MQLKTILISVFTSQDHTHAKSKVLNIITMWQHNSKTMRQRRFSSALSLLTNVSTPTINFMSSGNGLNQPQTFASFPNTTSSSTTTGPTTTILTEFYNQASSKFLNKEIPNHQPNFLQVAEEHNNNNNRSMLPSLGKRNSLEITANYNSFATMETISSTALQSNRLNNINNIFNDNNSSSSSEQEYIILFHN